ncbi:MAG: Hsp20/alpha crystallin family protein [Candidatus Micrarchaeota archaeon]|nr:Hsp20/alpha crystallin family protein [Candidatus Micrarchaeota archaeon]
MAKRKGGDINVNFDNVEDMNKFINKVVNELLSNNSILDNEATNSVYGFSIKIEQNRPQAPAQQRAPYVLPQQKAVEKSEPLIDIIDGKESVTVVMMMPGLKKDLLNVFADNRTVLINSSSPSWVYSKHLTMPEGIDPKSYNAKINNGVLEVVFAKSQRGSHSQVRLNIK